MLILGLFIIALADLPVHCTYKQLLGDWEFFLNLKTFEATLDNKETFCGHGQPDHVLNLDKNEDFSFGSEFKLFVSFEEPNHAYSDEFGAGV